MPTSTLPRRSSVADACTESTLRAGVPRHSRLRALKIPLEEAVTTVWVTALALAVCSWLGTGCHPASLQPSQVVADSVSGFSGEQGANGWFYGYWDYTADADKSYDQAADFRLLRNFGSDPINQLSARPELGTGKLWTLQDGVYYTSLWAGGGHPNGAMDLGTRAQVEHWAVRRWVSTTQGPVTISGHAAKVLATNWGGGVQVRIVVDGTTVFSSAIDNRGAQYSVSATVHNGSLVDFLIGPGLPDAYAVGVTELTATIRTGSALPGGASVRKP